MILKNAMLFGFVIVLAPVNVSANSAVDQFDKDVELLSAALTVGDGDLQVRVLSGNEMNLLDGALALSPNTTIRINLAKQQASVVGKKITDRLSMLKRGPQDDQEFIQEQLKAVIEPMRQFLDFIRNYKSTAQGIIGQCLKDQPYRKGLSPEESALYKFFEQTGPVDDIAAQVRSVDNLEVLCKDVHVLSASILQSLSDRAKGAFKDAMQKLQGNKKSPAKS